MYMKHPSLLKQIKYASIAPAYIMADSKSRKFTPWHLPLMKVNIDMESGDFVLDGNWQYLMSGSKHNDDNLNMHHRERININAKIYAAVPIDLNNTGNDGLMFPMEGTIKDGSCTNSCSGLLVIDNVHNWKGQFSPLWNVSFYLYDNQFGHCEITHKIPLHIADGNQLFN